jgi:PIN domain nuclease of toxin-antitoxin system
MIYVLGASAMLAYLRGEVGADIVENAILDTTGQCMAHSINLCEVYYIVHRDMDEPTAEAAIGDFKRLGVVERSDFDGALWKEAGKLKAGGGISLPDCIGRRCAIGARAGGRNCSTTCAATRWSTRRRSCAAAGRR